MRGHAQMIPFGLRRPILSIISHDKMKYFLEDIKQLDWGVEINSLDLEKKFEKYLQYLEHKPSELHKQIEIAQQKVWEETKNNFKKLKRLIKK